MNFYCKQQRGSSFTDWEKVPGFFELLGKLSPEAVVEWDEALEINNVKSPIRCTSVELFIFTDVMQRRAYLNYWKSLKEDPNILLLTSEYSYNNNHWWDSYDYDQKPVRVSKFTHDTGHHF
jgi:hypothetical protein